MRILLAHNSLYFPSYGGGDRSNRFLMEQLAARGHQVRVVARVEHFGDDAHWRLLTDLHTHRVHVNRTDETGLQFELNGVDVRVLSLRPHLRAFFAAHVRSFDPDVIITSTDDPAHLLLDVALRSKRARVVYLVRATIAAPFGPDSAMPSAAKAQALRAVDGAVGVSEYVAQYAREHGNLDAVYVPISLLPPGDPPNLGSLDNRFVSMVNPCAGKGISLFLDLANRCPDVEFAAVPTWGTTDADLVALRAQTNVTVLPPFDDLDDFLRQTRIMLVPSLWPEARSRMILEAMSRGIPVLASDVGGLAEAKLGVPYLLPVNPIRGFRTAVDELMVPVVDVPPQDATPWEQALRRLLTDSKHYAEISAQSRTAALEYAATLNAGPFEAYLEKIVESPQKERGGSTDKLSSEKQRLLQMRIKERRKHVDSRSGS